jgi:hypothetical protein
MINALGLASSVDSSLMLSVAGGVLIAAMVLYVVYFVFTAAMVILNFMWSSLKRVFGGAWRLITSR